MTLTRYLIPTALLVLTACAPKLTTWGDVTVAPDQNYLSNCQFIGPVTDADPITVDVDPIEGDLMVEAEPSENLRQAVADVGGNTIMVTSAGAGEAYLCNDMVGVLETE